MIQPRTMVNIADNTGAKLAQVFKVLGGSKKRYAQLGEIVVVSIKTAEPRKAVKKSEVHKVHKVRKIKKGDIVKIIAGKDKGKTSKVAKVIPSEEKINVEGMNI